jgi:hypothetical protein
MSAAARNFVKTIVGLALGAGIGVLVNEKVVPLADLEPPAGYGIADTGEPQPKETLKERWERALRAGEAAREAKEAELRSYFRHKVDDPTAFTMNRKDNLSQS